MKYAIVFLALLLVACSAPADVVIEEITDDTQEESSADSPNGNGIQEMHEEMEESMPGMEEQMDDMMVSEPDVTFVLTGENFAFFQDGVEAPELRVNVGDLVRVEFTSTQGFHDWVVDKFDAATDKVRDGEGMTAVEFVATEAGTFEYYCSVGSHRANGMVGNLIVE